jgi:hypothetical protein
MEKLTLNLDELQVESFAALAAEAPEDGTVLANGATLACTEKRSCGHICP